MELVAARKYGSKIDLADGYHNIRIEEDSEQYSTFLTHMGYYRSRIMQQGDRNAPATMVRAMYEIFKDMVKVWAKLVEEFCKELGSTNVVMGS